MTVHEGKRPFKCELWSNAKFFGTKPGLNMHTKSVHEEKKHTNVLFVKKKISLDSSLRQHLSSVHQMEKPFKYNICNSSFFRGDNLMKHLSSIHK